MDEQTPQLQQLELLRAPGRVQGAARRGRTAGASGKAGAGRAEWLPVARVAVDLPLPHLDRPFDYAVPADLERTALPGTRVKVRFAGQDVEGFVLERLASSDHPGRLAPLRRLVSPQIVLTPRMLALARTVADQCAGTLSDVLRLAVPARHARAERACPAEPDREPEEKPSSPGPVGGTAAGTAAWDLYPAGCAFLNRLATGRSPRAVWTALPGPAWTVAVAAAVGATVDSGRGALVVVPDHTDLQALAPAMTARLGPEGFVRLEAGQGAESRYTAFVALCRGLTRVAIGTRAAAFAPVRDLGLVVIWEDGDDAHVEQRAPYPHARQVLLTRAEQDGAAVLLGGWSRTAESAALLESGWAREIQAPRPVRRRLWPRVTVPDGLPDAAGPLAAARLPVPAWNAIRDGLKSGPVLLQVPRAGYVPVTRCQGCRRPARCPHCAGQVRVGPDRSLGCTWCGRHLPGWTCPTCGDGRLRAAAVGVDRTAEELGRAFPSVRLVVSRPGLRPTRVPEHGLVLATPGVEPAVPDGYAAAVLLDGDSLLQRPHLRAGEEALARWLGACALVRSAEEGGRVVLCADPQSPAVRAVVRADPAGHAAAELAERAQLGLPPAVGCATVTGDPAAVVSLLDLARLPEGAEVLGPVPLPDHLLHPDRPAESEQVRAVVRVPRALAGELAAQLAAAVALRSARRDPGTARVRMDPRDLG
jgi:primosomal protein N' (replication factor Y) (superfamily II helicase)